LWKFLHDLCNYGLVYFWQFKSQISEPEPIEKIPVVKTPVTPARAMDVNNSTVAGNICAIIKLLEQGGFGDPSDPETQALIEHLHQYVVLFHGDLETGERIQAIQLRRSIEKTFWNHLQYLIFVPGLFHVKMACADAIWRIFIQPT
jgi:hypothetical protein